MSHPRWEVFGRFWDTTIHQAHIWLLETLETKEPEKVAQTNYHRTETAWRVYREVGSVFVLLLSGDKGSPLWEFLARGRNKNPSRRAPYQGDSRFGSEGCTLSHFWARQGQLDSFSCAEHVWRKAPIVSYSSWGYTSQSTWISHQKTKLFHQAALPGNHKQEISWTQQQHMAQTAILG